MARVVVINCDIKEHASIRASGMDAIIDIIENNSNSTEQVCLKCSLFQASASQVFVSKPIAVEATVEGD